MSDLIFKTKDKETFRMPFPTPGSKCPDTKLEIKMTEPITLYLTLEELKLLDKYVEYGEETKELFDKVKQAYPLPPSPAEEAYKEWWGQYPELETDSKYDDMRWQGFQAGYELAQVKDGCPELPDEPEYYDEIEHDISENVENKTISQVINRWWMDTFTSKNQWDVDTCIDDLADQIEFWILRNKK